MTYLKLLDLDDNDLTSSIPSSLGDLTNLEYLLLNRNRLTGPVPAEVQSLSWLRLVFLDRNDLTGSLEMMCDLPGFNEDYSGTDSDLWSLIRENQHNESLAADCSEIECPCCDICCLDDDPVCHEHDFVPSFDGNWEGGYTRDFYQFGNVSVYVDLNPYT